MKTKILKNEKGVSLVLLALAVVVIFGFGALAIDIGHLYNVKNQLQVAADAAALAGAAKLVGENDFTQTKARNEAQKIAALNVADVAYDAVEALPPYSPDGAAEGMPIPVALQRNDANDAGGDIVVGNWDGTTFTPNLVPVNAVMVKARRWGTAPSQPQVQNWFARIFGIGSHLGVNYDNDFSLARVSAVAIAAKEKLPILPIAVNEYWDEATDKDGNPAPSSGGAYGQKYPESFMRSINADPAALPARGGQTFAIVGTGANANIDAFKFNSFVDVLTRNKYHIAVEVDPATGGAAWFDVVQNSGSGNCSPNCESANLSPRGSTTNGDVNPGKYGTNFEFMFRGMPDNVIPPNAVREVIRGPEHYTENNYNATNMNDPSKCPYAGVAAFSSSGAGGVVKKFQADDDLNGLRFYQKHPKGDRFMVMVYDGTHDNTGHSNQADVVTVIGYGIIEINGYRPNMWSPGQPLLDSGGTAYGHAVKHGLAGEEDLYLIQPPADDPTPDCSFTDKIREVQNSFATPRLVDPSLHYGLHQQ